MTEESRLEASKGTSRENDLEEYGLARRRRGKLAQMCLRTPIPGPGGGSGGDELTTCERQGGRGTPPQALLPRPASLMEVRRH